MLMMFMLIGVFFFQQVGLCLHVPSYSITWSSHRYFIELKPYSHNDTYYSLNPMISSYSSKLKFSSWMLISTSLGLPDSSSPLVNYFSSAPLFRFLLLFLLPFFPSSSSSSFFHTVLFNTILFRCSLHRSPLPALIRAMVSLQNTQSQTQIAIAAKLHRSVLSSEELIFHLIARRYSGCVGRQVMLPHIKGTYNTVGRSA